MAEGEVEAMECDTSSPELDPDVAEGYRQKGNDAYKAGQYQEARDFYSQAIHHNPNCATYYGNRSAVLLMLQEYKSALEDSITSLKLDEKFTKGYLRAAKCHLMMGNPSLSVDYYNKVLAVEPKNKQAKDEVDTTVRVLQQLDKASRDFDRGEYRTAVFHLDQCLYVVPACVTFRTRKAEALALCKRYDDAHALCNDLIRADRNNADAMYVKALCFYYQDVPEKATQFFQQALRVDPDHSKSRQAIKRSKQLVKKKEEGNAAFRCGSCQEAYDIYTEALDIDPLNTFTNAKLYCNRALVGSKLGKLKESIEDCSQAIDLDQSYVKAYQRRAKLYQENDQHDEAVRDLERVVQLERTYENQAAVKEGKRLLKLSKRKDYYKVLGVDKVANADDIKRAYRRAALRHHPDRHAAAEDEVREKEEMIFKEVSEAYSVLSDPRKKRKYDNGQDLEDMGMDIDPTHLFSNIFGGGGMGFGGGFGGNHFSFSSGGPEFTFRF